MGIKNKGQFSNSLIAQAEFILNQARLQNKLSKKQSNQLVWISKQLTNEAIENKALLAELDKIIQASTLKSKSYVKVKQKIRCNNQKQDEYKRLKQCGFYLDYYGFTIDYKKPVKQTKQKQKQTKTHTQIHTPKKRNASQLMADTLKASKIAMATNLQGL
jgi:hypothetical protein